MKTASEIAQQLINENPHLFKDNSETLLVIGTALINYGEKLVMDILLKAKQYEMKTELNSLSNIKP